MAESPASFDTLMGRVVEGSDAAVWELLERYSAQILRTVRRRLPMELRRKVDSVDVVQSTWLLLLRKQSRLSPFESPEQFIAFLTGVVKLKIKEINRKYIATQATDMRRETALQCDGLHMDSGAADRTKHPLEDYRGRSPSSIVGAREIWDRTIDHFGDRGQRILKLRLQGLSYDEVAVELGISTSTVRRTLQSMLHSLTR